MILVNRSKSASFEANTLIVILVILSIATIQCSGQVSESDDQFQVIHQDIGRISGGNSNSPVAPQPVLRQHQQAPSITASPISTQPQAAFERSSLNSGRSRVQHQHQQPAQATRRPRVTLAVRTAAPIQIVEPELVSVPAAPRVEPTFSSHSAAASAFHSQPAFQASPEAEQAFPQTNQASHSSFRSSLGHSNSVSARHSALIAEVAAERQAAANLNAQSNDFSHNQPTLGSPIEALSVPAVAQVQPPPVLQHQHQHQHQSAASQLSPAAHNFVNQPEEPLVAPSFEHVLGHGCPNKGVFSYENKDHCDRYYICTNGTFTEEACPNGLAYSQMGAVYQHCAYNWNVDCGKKKTSEPLASPGCPWQFGIFPITQAGQCSIDYYVCEWGVPETKRCTPEGLFYDDRIKGCQWADQLGCKSEALLNFKCPPEDEDNPYWPYPRYYHNKQDIIVCVNEQPRLVHCNEDQLVDPASLACLDIKKNKKKKF